MHTEVPPALLEEWLKQWASLNGVDRELSVRLLPHTPGSEILELSVIADGDDVVANVIFTQIHDRRGRAILSVRDQNTFDESLRRKRLSVLLHLFLIHRYKIASVHYLTPTEDNQAQTERMSELGLLDSVSNEVGEIIVADVATEQIEKLLEGESVLVDFLRKD